MVWDKELAPTGAQLEVFGVDHEAHLDLALQLVGEDGQHAEMVLELDGVGLELDGEESYFHVGEGLLLSE